MNSQGLIEVNPRKMSGTPEEGETIDQFLDQFPTVTREQVNGVLELSKEGPSV